MCCKYWPWGALCTISLTAGCDPGKLYEQDYVLEITDVVANEPVAGAQIVAWPENRRPRNQSEDDYLDQIEQERGARTTDATGQAVLTLRSGVLCGGDKCNDPAHIDQVTGRLFLVRVETSEASEIITLEMAPGNSISGEAFTVTVESIEEPYVVLTF